MPTSPKPVRKPKNAYHHGDLRASLLAAATREVERSGPEAVSLKALAVGLGVSQPAPYRHFSDREALLSAVAAGGFRSFSEALHTAGDDLLPLARAYLSFARRHRGIYRLMFASGAVPNSAPGSDLKEAATASFELLLRAVRKNMSSVRARRVALRVWASMHGLAMLEAEGFLSAPIAAEVDLDTLVREACAL